MRFFISSDLRKNKPLYFASVFFLVFSFVFWLAGWLHFYAKYTFSKEGLLRYYFLDPEFPQKPSLSQISEDLHVSLFLNAMLLLVLFSLANLFVPSGRLKLFLIAFNSLSLLFYLFSDFVLYFGGKDFVLLKPFSFVVYQFALLLLLVFVSYGMLRKNSGTDLNILRSIVLFFSLFSLLFLFSNFFNFFVKMGFGVEGIKLYYLGNPELFVKGKSFEGVFKVFYPHLLAMGVYVLTLSHLLPFAGLSFKRTLRLSMPLWLGSYADNLSSLLILWLGSPVAYVKLASFWLFQLTALYCTLILLLAFKKGIKAPPVQL